MRCSSCGHVGPPEDFPRNRSARSGRGAYCKPCHNRIGKRNRERAHGSVRQFHLMRRYGMDEVEFEWLALQQGGVCAICLEGRGEHVDHDHRSGRVRGLLCFGCNRALGVLREDVGLLSDVLAYLERTADRT